MTLIVLKNYDVLSFPALLRIALKTIYDIKNITPDEMKQMQDSIVKWNKHLTLKRDMNEESEVDKENQIYLEYIATILHNDAHGKYDKRKAMFQEHDIDYKKFYRLPEAYTPKDFHDALVEHSKLPPDER